MTGSPAALLALAFGLAGSSAAAECLSFTAAPAGSGCRPDQGAVRWLNAPSRPEIVAVRKRDWEPSFCCHDPLIADPAFKRGAAFQGDADFDFAAAGEHILEVFLWGIADDHYLPYSLEVAGQTAGTVSQYLQTQMTLVGVIRGPGRFHIRTSSPRYVLTGVRWTARDNYESSEVPRILRRVRGLMSDPFFDGPERRRQRFSLIQLYPRLALSRRSDFRREALLGLARVAYWNYAESLYPTPAMVATRLQDGLAVAPDDLILRQTISAACLGQNQVRSPAEFRGLLGCDAAAPVSWDVSLPPTPANAPGWAVAQRRLRARLDAITRYWVEKRQRADGQVGGGWGDDVEMLRSWGPQALGLGSEIAAVGLKRMAAGVWSSGLLEKGYSREVEDSEHGAELAADTQPLLAALDPDDPEIRSRLAESASCLRNWIARQPDGHWRFRSYFFNCSRVDPNAGRAFDIHYNVRAAGLALWQAYLTRDPWLVDLLTKWADSWVRAMRSTEHGKPPGLFPPMIRSSDGSYRVSACPWNKPENELALDNHWSGYSQEALASLVLAAYDLSGQRRWLDAAAESFQVLGRCEEFPSFCRELLNHPEALYEWRRQSGDTRFDPLLRTLPGRDDSATLRLLEHEARKMEDAIRFNLDMFTTEALFTDRVNPLWSAEYKLHLFGGDAPRGERYPAFSVTWPPVSAQFARAVLESSPRTLRLRIYNFEDREITAPVLLWRLEPGEYERRVVLVEGKAPERVRVSIRRRPQRVEIPVPARAEASISFSPVSAGEAGHPQGAAVAQVATQ